MPDILTPETQSKLALYRQKSLDGSITREELIEGIKLLRAGRLAAASKPAGSKRVSSKAPARSADDLLGDLGI